MQETKIKAINNFTKLKRVLYFCIVLKPNKKKNLGITGLLDSILNLKITLL